MSDEGTFLRRTGIICFCLAVPFLVFGFSIDIGVGVDVDRSVVATGRVANLSKMHWQTICIQLGLGLAIIGAVLFAGGSLCGAVSGSTALLRKLSQAVTTAPAGGGSFRAQPSSHADVAPPLSPPSKPIGVMGYYCPGCSRLRGTESDKCIYCGSIEPVPVPSKRPAR